MKNALLLVLVLLLFNSNTIVAQKNIRYKLANKFHLEGDGSWDYVTKEKGTSRLFVSHGTMVQVMDINTGKLIGTIPNTKGVHGIALAPDLNKGFTSNGKDTSVTIFNLRTLDSITTVKVNGINPDAILYDEFTHRVIAFNGKSHNATVIDAQTNLVDGTVKLVGKPEFAVSDGNGRIFVNIEDSSLIMVINAITLKVERKWKLAPGTAPSGLALDNINHRLFAVCDNALMIIMDSEDGYIKAQIPIGEGADGVVFDPKTKRAYSSNGDGTITVVQEVNPTLFKFVETISTQAGARTIAIDTKTGHLYLPVALMGEKPEPTEENPRPRAKIKEGTFTVLDIEAIQ